MSKLEVVERYQWYIINALMFKVSGLEKSIADGEASIKARPQNDHNPVYASIEGMIGHCKQSLKEHKEALDALKAAGFK